MAVYVGEYVEFQIEVPDRYSAEGWFVFGAAQSDVAQAGHVRMTALFCRDDEVGVPDASCQIVNRSFAGRVGVTSGVATIQVRDTPLGTISVSAAAKTPVGIPLTNCPAAWQQWRLTVDNTTQTARDAVWRGSIAGRRVAANRGCNYYDPSGVARVTYR